MFETTSLNSRGALPFLFGIALLCMGCSHSLSRHFPNNTYLEDSYTYLINDSLQFLHKTYGDVVFTTNGDSLLKNIPRNLEPLRNILAHGSTQMPPYYDYYLLLDAPRRRKAEEGTILRDTLLGRHRITFVGIPKNPEESASDFDYIASNLYLGMGYRDHLVSLFDRLGDCFNRSTRYYQCLARADDFPSSLLADQSMREQMKLTFASFMGNNFLYRELIRQWIPSSRNAGELTPSLLANGAHEVLDHLDSLLPRHQVVMVNENHFYPEHRKLVSALLPLAWKHGFRYLALEALSPGAEKGLNQGIPPTTETGFYTREPNFLALLTEAQALGFTLVSYEAVDDPRREEVQARQLYEQTLARDKDARVLVLAGVSHIHEKPDQNGKKWMAQVFRESYGIDPLTLSQTALAGWDLPDSNLALFDPAKSGRPEYQKVDLLLLNKLQDTVPNPNFTYRNPYPFPVQLALFRGEDLSPRVYPDERLPIRSYLLDAEEAFQAELDHAVPYFLYVLDSGGKVLAGKPVWE